jgi:hypothetical protein
MTRWILAASLAAGLVLAAGTAGAEEGAAAPAAKKINCIILGGGHGFDEKAFMKVFEGYDDINAKLVMQKAGGEVFDDVSDWSYDVIILYNFGQQINEKQQENLLKLMDKGVGLFVLHHACAAYPKWDGFLKVAGVAFYVEPREVGGVKKPASGAAGGKKFQIHVADADHAITKGLADYDMADETYIRQDFDPGVHVLLTTDEPSSDKIIAFTKTCRKSNVFYLQSGHDAAAYNNPNFRTVVARAIRWVAKRPAEVKAAARPEPARATRTIYAAPAADEKPAARKISIAVVTGGHGFEEKPFLTLFQGYDDIEYKHLPGNQDGAVFEDTSDFPYQVIVLYNMGQNITEKRQKNFIELLNRGVGLVALHHCIGGWQDWPEYKMIIGGKFFTKPGEINGIKYPVSPWKDDVDYKIHIADAAHPITQGLADFAIKDETYKGFWVDPQVHVLLTTDEPTCGKTIGWTKTYGKANVCYLMNGHGPSAFASKEYRTLVVRAIRWAGGTLK